MTEIRQQRKVRKTITTELLRLARECSDRNKDTKEVAELLGLSISASRTLMHQIACGLSDDEIVVKKGRKNKDHSVIKGLISVTLMNENSLTQRGLKEVIADAGHNVSQPAVSRLLIAMEFTRKRLTLVPVERNAPRILEQRQVYARSINNIPMEKLVFLDETGFNLHTTQRFGYSPKNEKAFVTVPASRGQNISLMAAIDINGIVAHELMDGSYNGEIFKNYIRNYLLPYFTQHPDYVLIMDNCRFHHRSDVLALLGQHRIAFKFLPAYSPQLNPIEEYFGELKSKYRAILPLAVSRDEIKTRVRRIISERTGSFVPGFTKARSLLQNALARQPFI